MSAYEHAENIYQSFTCYSRKWVQDYKESQIFLGANEFDVVWPFDGGEAIPHGMPSDIPSENEFTHKFYFHVCNINP
jgi:hypothetical protein